MNSSPRPDLSDIRRGDWVDRLLPEHVRPFARLARIDRPVGVWLTMFPCLAALIQASGGIPRARLLILYCLGALLMRSAGSTINDIADRNFDGHVERTRLRPLATGAVRTSGAVLFLIVELTLAAALLLFLTPLTGLLAIAVLPLVLVYPFCKRFTYWPQAVLGAAFNWGMLMAWSEVRGFVPAGAAVMWGGAVAWQIGYDTIYGYVDARDDARLGLRSTALLFGPRGKLIIGAFYAAAIAAWSIGGWMVGMSPLYQLALLPVGFHLAWQLVRFQIEEPAVNFRMFLSNIGTAAGLALAALAGTFQP